MVKVYVNKIMVEVQPNMYIIDAIEMAGFSVPTLCYLQGIFNEATCRICIVRANGKVVPACRYPVQEGMEITVDDDELIKMRRTNFELILASHKISCWNCIRKGKCILVKLSNELGVEGIPVCAECPLYSELCLLKKGIPCLGPFTIAGCNAICIKQNTSCIGCRGFIKSVNLWKNAAAYLRELGADLKLVKAVMSIFWAHLPKELDNVLGGEL